MEPCPAALVTPWLPRATLGVDMDALPSPSDLRDHLWVDMVFRGDCTAQCEAMELLARLACVDARAAWTLLLDTLGKRAYLDDILTAHVPMRFRLTVPTAVFADDSPFETLKDLLGWGGPVLKHSPGFETARQALMAMVPCATGNDPSAVLCLQQQGRSSLQGTATMLARLVALADAQAQHATAWLQWTHVTLGNLDVTTLDVVYDHLNRLLDLGVSVKCLSLPPRATVADGSAATRFWRRSLGANGIRSLVLPITMDTQTFQDVCSAVATATAPLKIAWRTRPGDEHDEPVDLVARWTRLACSLFRTGEETQVMHSVSLNLSGFTLREARAVERAVAAGSVAGSWAPCIDHLSLLVSPTTSQEATVLLVHTVGVNVRRLTMGFEYQPSEGTAFWRSLLAACPSLERLDVMEVELFSLDWLLDTKLRVLSLDGVHLDHPERELGPVLDGLADPKHPLSRHLCEFHTQWDLVEPCLDRVFAMLEANPRLERFLLSSEIKVSNWRLPRLTEFRALSIAPPSRHATLRLRLAFLSVFGRATQSATSSCGLPLLDPLAHSLVWAFAAPRRRVCDMIHREW